MHSHLLIVPYRPVTFVPHIQNEDAPTTNNDSCYAVQYNGSYRDTTFLATGKPFVFLALLIALVFISIYVYTTIKESYA